MDEKKFKSQVKKALRSFFVYTTHDAGRAGVPDLYACKGGLSIWLELKYSQGGSLGHPLTPQQSHFLSEINEHGGLGCVLIGTPEGCHLEIITEVGKRSKFEYDFKPLEEIVDWISKYAMDFATQDSTSNTL